MRLAIDLQGCQTDSRFRGIGRYSLAITKEIIKANVSGETLIVLNGNMQNRTSEIIDSFEGILPQQSFKSFSVPSQLIRFRGTWREEVAKLLREAFIASLEPDFLLITSLFEGNNDDSVISVNQLPGGYRTAAIHYDIIPIRFPEAYLGNAAYRKRYFEKISYLRNTDLILAISDFTRKDAISSLSIDPEHIENVSSAVDPKFRVKNYENSFSSNLLLRLKITKPYIMYTGGFDERKNVQTLIKSFANLPYDLRQKYQLLLVGKILQTEQTSIVALAKELRVDESILITGFIPDDELIFLYNKCALFVFPSYYEGFGLPVLEAMSCGAPVIGSNNTSIIEVIQNADAMFDAENTNDITALMEKALTDDVFRFQLQENGKRQSGQFSWQTSGKLALAHMENFLASRAPDVKIPRDELYKELITKIAKIPGIKHDLSKRDYQDLAGLIYFNGLNA